MWSCKMMYGRTVSLAHEKMAGIAPDDFLSHVYILGGTGSGKSSLIRSIYKHLELANQNGTLASSAIYIDVKDEDAGLFLRQCEKSSVENDLITYLDINKTNFGINPLELPKYEPEDRDVIVSRMVGHVVEMFKEFYSQQQTFVQLERILRLLLHYLYSNTDSPTLLDLYEIIARLHRGGKTELQDILRHYKKTTGAEMKTALESVSILAKDSWVSLFNRIEPFATDSYLKKKFSVRHTTIDFDRMLIPGNITIFRISDTDTPKHVQGMAIMAVVMKIWFALQNRARKTSPDQRTLVVLALDEFQKIRDLSILTSILSQARTYGMSLILSHQNLAQIDAELLETIVGNSATQFYGKMSGVDAARISRMVEPDLGDKLTAQLTAQPDFVFTARPRPPQGSEQSMPVQFKAMTPPKPLLDEGTVATLLEKMRDRYGTSEQAQSELSSDMTTTPSWKKQLSAEFRTKDEWHSMLFLRDGSANLTQIVGGTNSTNRYRTSQAVRRLLECGLIFVERSTRRGPVIQNYYALSSKANETYFPKSFQTIGRTDDVDEIAKIALDYYLGKKMFVCVAKQNTTRADLACDMVAYDYDNDAPVSVEIESGIQVRSHPEQVRFNMIKWKSLGFVRCHVWSKSPKVRTIMQNLGKEATGVQVFDVESKQKDND